MGQNRGWGPHTSALLVYHLPRDLGPGERPLPGPALKELIPQGEREGLPLPSLDSQTGQNVAPLALCAP